MNVNGLMDERKVQLLIDDQEFFVMRPHENAIEEMVRMS
jgi:hypothetical protein